MARQDLPRPRLAGPAGGEGLDDGAGDIEADDPPALKALGEQIEDDASAGADLEDRPGGDVVAQPGLVLAG